MNKKRIITILIVTIAFLTISFKNCIKEISYVVTYNEKLLDFKNQQLNLLKLIEESDLESPKDVEKIKNQIDLSRINLKGMDFWLRYLEPVSYKKINGPLPVEWETEVFEKFEKPYKREGAGLTLATMYLEELVIEKDSLVRLIKSSLNATQSYSADSITDHLKSYHHFYLCNRLFLLNLAAIYTTGFECPDTSRVVPELRSMLNDVHQTYQVFNESFPETPLTENYLLLYNDLIKFVNQQLSAFSRFDHFTFIKEYVNPLYSINQKLINQYHVVSKNMIDYSLNKNNNSIFSKNLYHGQNPKGIYLRVKDPKVLNEIEKVGRLLFYDPILSGNNLRSCASCHNPTQYFTDTLSQTSLQFNRQDFLSRNSPSLINAGFNHLIMLDGKHISLQHQAKAVVVNPIELGGNELEAVKKVMSCDEYKTIFKNLLKYTPQEKGVTFDHIVSAITFYYSKFSNYYSPFDEAMNSDKDVHASVKNGFNLFMSKAQCGTCHFVPLFNGVKPPYTNSEFEILGVPDSKEQKRLSSDKGRFDVHPALETMNAFRTGSIRNAEHTGPYMHNGIFSSLSQVIDFYNEGGGFGRGLNVNNQTLSSDSLHLTELEKQDLISFIKSLNENIQFDYPPDKLPISIIKSLNSRKVGGEY